MMMVGMAYPLAQSTFETSMKQRCQGCQDFYWVTAMHYARDSLTEATSTIMPPPRSRTSFSDCAYDVFSCASQDASTQLPPGAVTSLNLVGQLPFPFYSLHVPSTIPSFIPGSTDLTDTGVTGHDHLNNIRGTMQSPASTVADTSLLTVPHHGAVNRQPPAPSAWAAVKDKVESLYVNEERPLHEVKEILEREDGFRASQRMFKDRLKKWGFSKNLTKEDWIALAVLYVRRKAEGKRSTEFSVRERRKTLRDLQKYSRSQGLDETRLAASASPDLRIPNYLRASTPPPVERSALKDVPSDESCRASNSPKESPAERTPDPAIETYVTGSTGEHFLSTLSHQAGQLSSASRRPIACTLPPATDLCPQVPPISLGSASSALADSTMTGSTPSDDFVFARTMQTAPPLIVDVDTVMTDAEEPLSSSWSSSFQSCDGISRDFEYMGHQLTDPTPLRSRHDAEDIHSWMLLQLPKEGDNLSNHLLTCSVCHQPSSTHFVSLHNAVSYEPTRNILNDSPGEAFQLPATTKEDGAWKWIALCFAYCMQLNRGNPEFAAQALNDARVEFEKLLVRRDAMLLTAANQMITILHMHDAGQIAVDVTGTAKSVAVQYLPPDDPIRITLSYLAATANSSVGDDALRKEGITSDALERVHLSFNNNADYGARHPYTISASYNHTWLLKREGKNAEAEQRLSSVYQMSCSIFGKHHMQSVTALASWAGALFGQGKNTEAIKLFKMVIRDCEPTLGKSHPYRLEAKRRLALQYEALGQKEKMVHLYWEVLVGRVSMLGLKHSYTLGARRDYEKLMTELERWDDSAREEVEALFDGKRRAEEEATRRRRQQQPQQQRDRSGSNSSHESQCLAF